MSVRPPRALLVLAPLLGLLALRAGAAPPHAGPPAPRAPDAGSGAPPRGTPALSERDREVARDLELLRNLELLQDMDLCDPADAGPDEDD